jgi:hypothetical protein
MNAKEARQLTEIYLHPDIDMLVADIDRRIEEAAKHGKTKIIDPDLGHLNDGNHFQLSREQRRALRLHYESRGFTWQDSPKAGHPCCRGLTSISW